MASSCSSSNQTWLITGVGLSRSSAKSMSPISAGIAMRGGGRDLINGGGGGGYFGSDGGERFRRTKELCAVVCTRGKVGTEGKVERGGVGRGGEGSGFENLLRQRGLTSVVREGASREKMMESGRDMQEGDEPSEENEIKSWNSRA